MGYPDGFPAMKKSPPSVLVIVAAVAALLAFNAAMDYYRAAEEAAREPDPYRLERQRERFRPVREAIPPEAVVGYLSDLPRGEFAARIAFSGAQYALAPRLLVPVDRFPGGGYVIGNYTVDVAGTDIVARAIENHGLEFVRDYGAGLVLYRKP